MLFLQQEIISSQAGPALWSVHTAEAVVHRDRVYGERLPAEVSQGQKGNAYQGDAAEYVPGCLRRNGVSGEELLHP